MQRTTVYLTHAQRLSLKETARRRRVSEAELIREGVDLVTTEDTVPPPRIPLFKSGDPTLAERIDEALRGFGE